MDGFFGCTTSRCHVTAGRPHAWERRCYRPQRPRGVPTVVPWFYGAYCELCYVVQNTSTLLNRFCVACVGCSRGENGPTGCSKQPVHAARWRCAIVYRGFFRENDFLFCVCLFLWGKDGAARFPCPLVKCWCYSGAVTPGVANPRCIDWSLSSLRASMVYTD